MVTALTGFGPLERKGSDPFFVATPWHVLRLVFEDAQSKLTRGQIMRQWPRDFPRPSRATLGRWLTDALKFNYIETAGTGRRTDSFRYWLPEKQKDSEADPLYFLPRPARQGKTGSM